MPGDRPSICHVTSVHVPTDSRVLFHECRTLARRYRTLLVCRDVGGSRTLEGVEILPLPRTGGRLSRVVGSREIAQAAEETGAALFHFHDPELLPAMADLRLKTGKPVIYDAHEHYPDAMDQKAWIPAPFRPTAARWAERTERTYVPKLSAVVVADSALRERFTAMHPRVVELDNYPPLSLFEAPLDSATPTLRAEGRTTGAAEAAPGPPARTTGARPPNGPPVLVYVGSVSKVRGFYEMSEVLLRVRERVSDARLVIFGKPTEEVARHLQSFLKTLPPGALEMRGAISYGAIGDALRGASVGLSLLQPHPKYDKNVSMKVFDYMAAEVPYVASDFAPLRQATGGVGGFLVPAGSVADAAQAVLRLLEDGEIRERKGTEGRRLVEHTLNWESMEPRLFGLYEELLEGSG